MEIQTHPYEVLVRFSCEKGEVAGAIRGIHMITAAYAVDDDGKIVGSMDQGAENLAKEATQAEIAKIIGAATVSTEIAHLNSIEALKAAHSEEVAVMQSTISALSAELEKSRADLSDATERLAAAESALQIASESIAAA